MYRDIRATKEEAVVCVETFLRHFYGLRFYSISYLFPHLHVQSQAKKKNIIIINEYTFVVGITNEVSPREGICCFLILSFF